MPTKQENLILDPGEGQTYHKQSSFELYLRVDIWRTSNPRRTCCLGVSTYPCHVYIFLFVMPLRVYDCFKSKTK